MKISIEVNGVDHELEVAPNALLVDVIRNQLHLTGTHIGCDTTQCGACTVHMNGLAVKSCTVLAAQADGQAVTTIEGIGTPADLHPMQAAFKEHHALQCGFCTPGMIMRGIDLVNNTDSLTDATIRAGLEGNICRCTGYQNIVKAMRHAAQEMAPEKEVV